MALAVSNKCARGLGPLYLVVQPGNGTGEQTEDKPGITSELNPLLAVGDQLHVLPVSPARAFEPHAVIVKCLFTGCHPRDWESVFARYFR